MRDLEKRNGRRQEMEGGGVKRFVQRASAAKGKRQSCDELERAENDGQRNRDGRASNSLQSPKTQAWGVLGILVAIDNGSRNGAGSSSMGQRRRDSVDTVCKVPYRWSYHFQWTIPDLRSGAHFAVLGVVME
jgi:hypothetical protein